MNESFQLLRVLGRNFRVLTFCYLSVKRRKVTGLKGYFQRAKFIDQTAQRPYIAFITIFLSRPNLRTCVIRSSSLCRAKPILGNFGHIHIAQFGHSFHEEYVSTLDVSVDNVIFMQAFQSLQDLIGYLPDKFLFKALARLLIFSFHYLVLHYFKSTCKSPPSANSINTQSQCVSVSKNDPSYLMTVGMLIDARRRT